MSDKVIIKHHGLGTLLFITFLVLKLTGVISWSWWWITAPLWIPLALIIGAVAFVFLILFLVAIAEAIYNED